jgi:hypothetical protein
VLAGEHLLELEALEVLLDPSGVLRRLGARRVVARLLGELVQRLGVLERAADLVVRARGLLELRLLLEERLRAGVVAPERRVLREPRDLGDAVPLPVDVKATPGGPPGGGSAPRCARSSVRPCRLVSSVE